MSMRAVVMRVLSSLYTKAKRVPRMPSLPNFSQRPCWFEKLWSGCVDVVPKKAPSAAKVQKSFAPPSSWMRYVPTQVDGALSATREVGGAASTAAGRDAKSRVFTSLLDMTEATLTLCVEQSVRLAPLPGRAEHRPRVQDLEV